MECPVCGGTNIQSSIIKYKCIDCKQIFEIPEDELISDYII